ncbi:MAG: translation initiation factor [Nanoarchaeota archaeon]|nr:translation initiation factor [Nanoarchaeota archaeon]MBU4452351.1 translation initiation factor [Nanoarchaeota archaeon]MCG2723372.1 translation initiation factor [archaeon]
MQDICNKCGLPKELCVCETISREVQKVRVYMVKRRFGKLSTVIDGLDEKSVDIKKLVSVLKTELACGGTYKNGAIELQGKHKNKAINILIKQGFSQESISS